MKFDEEAFNKWQAETHIPYDIMDMVNYIAEKLGYDKVIEETTIDLYDYYGCIFGHAKGFTISHCTSSYADGPSADLSGAFSKWLCGLDFKIANSYGDNGMDYATNGRDTYWYNEFIYEPSIVVENKFVYE